MAFTVRIIPRIEDIPETEWNALHGDDDSPFVEWKFLHALESTGCAVPERGWNPAHITVWQDGQLAMATPSYVKTHSEGEFVFDWGWANLASRMGIEYYPKLILAVPFTPATGARLLRRREIPLDEAAQVIASAATALAQQARLSSVHMLFPHAAEAEAMERAGYALRLGVQFHWHNAGYKTFDDFLARFRSKKRNSIKRECAQVARDTMTITTLRGDDITREFVDPMYEFYTRTVDQFFYGRRYLTRAFFSRMQEDFRHRLEWVVAREQDGTPVAGAFNATRGSRLYGRYWGTTVEREFLHFNVCFYHAIREGISRGISLFEPGAGGEHKLVRGFEPAITWSAHWIADAKFNQIVRTFLTKETASIREAVAREMQESPLHKP